MDSTLTFGEYMHRLRRHRKWTLNNLAEHSGLSYTHLSRLENDSVVPTAESVAKLAEALDGDLKAMLELANCLPRVILDRISSQEDRQMHNLLLRTAGSHEDQQTVQARDIKHPLVEKLKETYELGDDEAAPLALAIDELVQMDGLQRLAFFTVIAGQRRAEQEG
jgi:transcriptional regulator with XRE-family HTH domain